MSAEPVAGEKIAREEEIEALAVKAAMPLCMTGKMNDAQSAPVRQFSTGNERLIHGNGSVLE